MTDVGSVSVGVDVNGSGLGEKLAATIRAAILPVIADLNRELDATNRKLNSIDGGGLSKVVAQARAAADGVKDLSRDATSAAAALDRIDSAEMRKLAQASRTAATAVKDVGQNATASARLTTLAADKMIRDYDRVGNAAQRSADKQIEAAARVAAANRAASDAGNRSGGGRGGGGGGGFGGGGGILGFLTGPVGLNALSLATTAVGPAALGITNLAGAVQQLGQAGLLVPGVIAAIGSSFATAKIATLGMGDAVKDLYKALGSGDPKELKKANAEIALLPQNVQDTVHALGDLFPALKDVQKTLANNMFADIGQQIKDVGGKDIPIFKEGLGQISTAWNGTLKSILSAAGADSTGGFLKTIFGNTAQAQTIANQAIAPFVHAFGTLAATGTNFLPRLATGLDALATRFDTFITKIAGNGDLDKFINQGIEATKNLGTSALNVLKIFDDLTTAAGGDGGFLKALSDGTTKLHDFLSSADGQNKLKDFFASAREEWAQWKPILLDLATGIGQVFTGLHDWGSVILPIFGQITGFLTGMPGLVSTAVAAFVGFRTISGLAGLLGDLGKVNTALGTPGGGAGGGLLGKLSLLKTVGGIAALGLGSNLLEDPNASAATKLGGAAADIGGGALLGSQFGPYGTAVGAVIGTLKAIFDTVNATVQQGKRDFDKYAQDNADHPNRPGSPNNVPGRNLFEHPSLNAPTISASLIPKIRAGQLPGFAINADGQVINTKTGQVLPLPGDLTTVPPGAPPPPPPPLPNISNVPNVGGVPFPAVPGPPRPTPKVTTNQIDPTTGLFVVPGSGGPAPVIPQNTSPLLAGPAAGGIDTINASVKAAIASVGVLSSDIQSLPSGQVQIKDSTPEVIERLKALGLAVTQLPGGVLKVTVQYIDPLGFVTSGGIGHGVGLTAVTPGGKAGGGVFPGYAPGVDSILSWVSPGEGLLIPEAVRGIGGASAVYALNSRYRSGLSRAGYADGGVVPDGTGLGVQLGGGDVIGLLTQIRDLLAGAGAGDTPLKGIRKNTDALGTPGTSATGLPGTAKIGPFGTPLKQKGDPAYRAAAAAISALGGNPEEFIGTDPTLTAAGGGAAGSTDQIAALAQFARTGIVGPGVDPTSPLVKSIVTARGKKKGGLGGDAIADLVTSTLSTGTFSGTLDSSNSALVSALLKGAGKTGLGSTTGGVTGGGLPGVGADQALAGAAVGNLSASAVGVQSVFVVNWPGQPLNVPGGATTGVGQATPPGGGPGVGPDGQPTSFPGSSIVQSGFSAAGGVASNLAGGLIDAIASGTDIKTGVPTAPSTSLSTLVKQRNLTGSAAAAFGLNVPDYTRQGGQGNQFDQNQTKFDSKGRMFSDSAELVDRTFTDLQAQIKASFDQQAEVLNQIKTSLAKEALEPVVRSAVTEGIGAIGDKVTSQLGTAIGQAAAGPIADAVRSAVASIPKGDSSGGGDIGSALGAGTSNVGGAVLGSLFDEGGLWESGTYGTNLSGSYERVLSPSQTALFDSGLYGGWNIQPQQQHGATTSGVDATSTVGADFFGVSQIPFIGAIVNMLVSILLKLIGVQIDARDTLNEMTDNVRQFRGEFQKFDASGRLFNDTSGLLDRSGSSEQTAADERIRILKIVLEGLVQFIIEKILVPIGEAVANAAISAGGAAAGGALNSVAPGAGGIVQSLITSGGQAGVSIVGDLVTEFAKAAVPVLLDGAFEGLQSLFPDLLTTLFGGAGLASIANPISGLLSSVFGIFTGGGLGGIAGIFSSLLGGLALFDDGGIANGVGLMPKATIRPERVLSPNQTELFGRMVTALEGGRNGGNATTTLHAPITVTGGGEQAANAAYGKLQSLLGA